MHVIIPALGTSGDVFPMIGIAEALVRRRHKVTLIAHDVFEPHVQPLGIDFVSLGTKEEYLEVFGNPKVWDWKVGYTVLAQLVVPSIPRVYDAIMARQGANTVVVCSQLAYGARVAREMCPMPLVTVHVTPLSVRSMSDPTLVHPMFFRNLPSIFVRFQYWIGDVLVTHPVMGRPVCEFRAKLGLPPVGHFTTWVHSPDRALGIYPSWFAPPQADWPEQTRLTGFLHYDGQQVTPASDELKDFLDAGDPPVAFTAGSVMQNSQEFFAEAAEACRMLGIRGLLMTPFPEMAPKKLPPGVRQEYAPFSWLLPRVSAVVHHSGLGTGARAMAAGIPQLVMPMAFDQFHNAMRLEQLGVARKISRASFRAPKVAAMLREILGSRDVARSCRDLAQRLAAQDAMEETCQVIEDLAPIPAVQSVRN